MRTLSTKQERAILNMLKIGHRGAGGYEPENTLRSFKKALDLGVDMVELDVRKCKSGEIVVIHDGSVRRTTGGLGKVRNLTLAELKKLNAGKGEFIPTLEEVLDLIGGKTKISIEIKARNIEKELVNLLQDYIKQNKYTYEHFIISYFNYFALYKIKFLDKKFRIGLLAKKKNYAKVAFWLVAPLNAYSIHPHYTITALELVEKAHKKGLRVFVWTVNDVAEIERLKTLGVDGIFSDYPDRIKISE